MDIEKRQEEVFNEWWSRFTFPDGYKRAMYQAFLIGWHDGVRLGIDLYSKPAPIAMCHDCPKAAAMIAATSAHGTEPSDSEPQASSTGEDGRSQEAADGGKAVMEEKE
jgi:hypothetical protein